MNFRRMLADLRARLSPHTSDPTAAKPVVARDESGGSTDSAGSSSADSSPRAATATDAQLAADDDTKGFEQSPIDICALDSDLVRQDDDAVSISVGSARACVVQTGGNFRVDWLGEHTNAIRIKGKTYYAIQFHFHAPSEHTLSGQHEAMELHLVHQASDGSLAVVALFFREGRENEFLAQFFDELPACESDGAAVELTREVDPRCLQLLSGLFYHYRGSLTTPPYSEGVEWVVLQDVAEASAQQIAHYRSTIPAENARAVQPRNHRLVTLHRPGACSA